MHKRIQELKLGAKVVRRRREPSRGAEGAKGGGVGGVPFPTERGVWGCLLYTSDAADE